MSLRFFLGICAVLALTSCDTPSGRARCYPGAFGKLSPGDRRLVLTGKVHAGMDMTSVYIAWGAPDSQWRAGDGKDPSETWLYHRQVMLKPAMDSFDRWLPGGRVFGAPIGGGSGFGFGGVGNEGMTLYQPHILLADDTIKRAVFEDGRLARYEEFQAGDAPVR